jgi:hypothetical protein
LYKFKELKASCEYVAPGTEEPAQERPAIDTADPEQEMPGPGNDESN